MSNTITATTTPKKRRAKNNQKHLAWLVPVVCIIAAELIYYFVLGNPSGFQDPVNKKMPLNALAKMYEGGFVVPILIGFLFMVIVFSIERYFTIKSSMGKKDNTDFIQDIQDLLETRDLDGAMALCNQQKGTVANVMVSGLSAYKEMIHDTELNKEQKLAYIQKELEEATALELPIDHDLIGSINGFAWNGFGYDSIVWCIG
jgi:biopolymer transport protein ExbB